MAVEYLKDKNDLLKRVGSLSQIFGAKRYRIIGGAADGLDCVDVRNGSGLNFTIIPGRGLDIAWAEFRGVPFSYISRCGLTGTGQYDPRGMEWLKNFSAGLLTTCGLSNVGGPCSENRPVVGKREYGLHGRINQLPADNVCVETEWDPDCGYSVTVRGTVTEATVHDEFFTLTREITTALGENRIVILDRIENESRTAVPIMYLYHFNFGYPFLGPLCELTIENSRVEPGNGMSARELERYDRFCEPEKEYVERLYFHHIEGDRYGMACISLYNPECGFGITIRYNVDTLPCLTEWKMMKEIEYVLGIEPGNTPPIGREQARKKGTLSILEAGQVVENRIALDIFTD
jgi:hypothetical protein